LQFGKVYAMHFVNLFKIRDYGNRNVRLVADMTISKERAVSLTSVNSREKVLGLSNMQHDYRRLR